MKWGSFSWWWFVIIKDFLFVMNWKQLTSKLIWIPIFECCRNEQLCQNMMNFFKFVFGCLKTIWKHSLYYKDADKVDHSRNDECYVVCFQAENGVECVVWCLLPNIFELFCAKFNTINEALWVELLQNQNIILWVVLGFLGN